MCRVLKGAKPPIMILLGGLSPPMQGNVLIFEYPGFASNHSVGRVYNVSVIFYILFKYGIFYDLDVLSFGSVFI